MLIAAAAGDSQRFDQIWNWTKQNLRRDDGLISFKWRDGKIEDPEAASDADVDAARALLVASCRFNQPGQAPGGPGAGRGDPRQGDRRGGREPGAHRRAVGQQRAPDHQPQLLLTGHLRGAGQGLRRRRRVGQPVGQLADDHRPADDRLLAAAARLGEARGRQAGADRHARRPRRRPRSSASTPRARWSGSPRTPTRPAARSRPGRGRCSRARTRTRSWWSATSPASRPAAPSIRSCSWPRPERPTPRARTSERDKLLNAASALDQNSSTYYGVGLGGDRSLHAQTDALDALLGALAALAHRA